MNKKIAIIGAGISGLTLAWNLVQKYGDEIELHIFEQSNRPGGWIQSIEHEGFIFEKGPRSCQVRGNGLSTLQLIQSLDLQQEVITASDDSRYRFVYLGGKLRQLPQTPLQIFQQPWLWPAIPGLVKDLFAKRQRNEESMDQFAKRHFNPFVAAHLIDPMISGIYAGDPKKISVNAAFPSLLALEKGYGSLLLGMILNSSKKKQTDPFITRLQKSGLFSFKHGMETLVHALHHKLEKYLHFNKTIQSIEPTPKGVKISTRSQTFEYDHLYSTISMHQLSKIDGPLHQLNSEFKGIQYASVAVVNFGYKQAFPLKGFGYLVPSKENEKILGVTWDSSAFPQQNRNPQETRITVMIGGIRFKNFENLTENQTLHIAKEAVFRQMQIKKEPDALHILHAHQAIPQYDLGHLDKIREIRQKASAVLPHVTLIGNSFDGVSVNDCIYNSLLI